LHLEPKAVDVLRYLVDRPGVLVSKHELIHAVWKDTAVGDNALTRLVAQLRKALEDPADRPPIDRVTSRRFPREAIASSRTRCRRARDRQRRRPCRRWYHRGARRSAG
jgi:hypothetical protein